MQKRFKITPAVYLVLLKNNKILLGRRKGSGFFDNYYSLPAGHLEGNETLTQAMLREAKEEIGIDFNPNQLLLIHVMNRKSTDGERVDFFFTIKNWDKKPKIMEQDKCDDLQWFDFESLPQNIIPYIKKVIENIAKNELYSEEKW